MGAFIWFSTSNSLHGNKNGRGPPTSPALRPHVLTPCDHYAHRGGGRGQRLCTTEPRMQSVCGLVNSGNCETSNDVLRWVIWINYCCLICKQLISRIESSTYKKFFRRTLFLKSGTHCVG